MEIIQQRYVMGKASFLLLFVFGFVMTHGSLIIFAHMNIYEYLILKIAFYCKHFIWDNFRYTEKLHR